MRVCLVVITAVVFIMLHAMIGTALHIFGIRNNVDGFHLKREQKLSLIALCATLGPMLVVGQVLADFDRNTFYLSQLFLMSTFLLMLSRCIYALGVWKGRRGGAREHMLVLNTRAHHEFVRKPSLQFDVL